MKIEGRKYRWKRGERRDNGNKFLRISQKEEREEEKEREERRKRGEKDKRRAGDKIKMVFWNIVGLSNKGEDFWKYIGDFDFISLSETWMEKKLWVRIKDRLLKNS